MATKTEIKEYRNLLAKAMDLLIASHYHEAGCAAGDKRAKGQVLCECGVGETVARIVGLDIEVCAHCREEEGTEYVRGMPLCKTCAAEEEETLK